MSFRLKLLLACLPLALGPLAFFGHQARTGVTARLDAQYAERVAALADVIEEDLVRESAAVAARLDRLAEAVTAENRIRLAVLEGDGAGGADRSYLLDYAARVMPLAGLDVLRIQDEDGRVLSSGHFRNEYDAVDTALPAAIRRAGGEAILVTVPSPDGPVRALARARSVTLGPRTLTLVGGTAVDEGFLDRLGRGTGLDVRLEAPAAAGAPAAGAVARPGGPAPAPVHAREVAIRFVDAGQDTLARFTVRASAAPLLALRRELDLRLAATAAAAAALALLLALAVSGRLSRPLAELARRANQVRLDRVDVAFALRRRDEIGELSRVLDRMTGRLRTSAARLREAERRATMGEMARQVNHDVRNGLIPIRNVVGHLAQLARDRPAELPAVFLERQGTLESSVEYLQSLASNYARLSPRLERRPCELNAIVRAVAGEAGGAAGEGRAGDAVVTELAPALPPVSGDPVAIRRIVENLVVNGLDALDPGGGRVTLSTRFEATAGGRRVRLIVSDTGRGMTPEVRARVFEDFFTTKDGGGGLGLSIVRRLVADLDGRIEIESEPGRGTRVTVDLPAAASAPTAAAGAGDDRRSAPRTPARAAPAGEGAP